MSVFLLKTQDYALLKAQHVRIGHLYEFILPTKWGQHITRVTANDCQLYSVSTGITVAAVSL